MQRKKARLIPFTSTWDSLPKRDWLTGVEPVGRSCLGLDEIAETIDKTKVHTIFEIGAEFGGATRVLLDRFPESRIVSIDLWPKGQFLPKEWSYLKPYIESGDGSFLPVFLKFNEAQKDRIYPMRASSIDALFWLKQNKIEPDLIYLDGDHTYTGLAMDLYFSHVLFPGVDIVGAPWSFSSKLGPYMGIEKSVEKAVTHFAQSTDRTIAVKRNTFKLSANARQVSTVEPADFKIDFKRLEQMQKAEQEAKETADKKAKADAPVVAKPDGPVPWFMHVKNGHKSCVVVFSAFAFAKYKDDAFSFKNEFMPYAEDTDILFVKDPDNQWYNRKIQGVGEDIESATKALDDLVAPYEHVTLFGSSMGGYASLLFGQRMKNVNRVVALGSQTFLKSPFPRFNPSIHTGKFVEISEDTFPESVKVQMFLGNNELFDVHQALCVQPQKNIEMNIVSGGYHNIVGYWQILGLLDDFISTMIRDPDPSAITAKKFIDCEDQQPGGKSLLDPEFKQWIDSAVISFYNEEYDKAIDTLEKIVKKYPEWAGARSLLGQSYYAQDRLKDAIEQFKKVTEVSSAVDGHFKSWVLALRKQNKPEEANKIAQKAVEVNRTMAFLLEDKE